MGKTPERPKALRRRHPAPAAAGHVRKRASRPPIGDAGLQLPHRQLVFWSCRLAADEAGMEAVFQLSKRLLPQPSDLSYFNWDTHTVAGSSTPNFEVRMRAAK
jgi:hypothetical protein